MITVVPVGVVGLPSSHAVLIAMKSATVMAQACLVMIHPRPVSRTDPIRRKNGGARKTIDRP
jgi:hypothetical protein